MTCAVRLKLFLLRPMNGAGSGLNFDLAASPEPVHEKKTGSRENTEGECETRGLRHRGMTNKEDSFEGHPA
jgi:hypothetical protein